MHLLSGCCQSDWQVQAELDAAKAQLKAQLEARDAVGVDGRTNDGAFSNPSVSCTALLALALLALALLALTLLALTICSSR